MVKIKNAVRRLVPLLLAFTMIVGQIQPAAAVTFVVSAQEAAEQADSSANESQQKAATEQVKDPIEDAAQGDASKAEDSDQSVQDESQEKSHTEDSAEAVVEQTIPASVGKDEIQLSGEMPEGAEVEVSKAKKAAEKAGLENVLCAFDITINDGWQPDEAVEVSITSKDITHKRVSVFHITDEGDAEEVEVLESKKGKVTFEAEGFSIYAVTEEVARRTYEFYEWKYDAWLPYEFDLKLPDSEETVRTNKQVLRNGDDLALPSMPNRNGQEFIGWFDSPDADINALEPIRGGVKNDINQDAYVTLYARYGTVKYITYHAAPEASAGDGKAVVYNTRKVIIPDGEISHEVDISGEPEITPPTNAQIFMGWAETGSTNTINTKKYVVSDNVDLYPVFNNVYWINFVSPVGSRATYIAPISVLSDHNTITGKLVETPPTRPGYSFKGWKLDGTLITDAQNALLSNVTKEVTGARLENGTLTLTGDITLESDWEAQETTYRVVFWREKASDTKKLVKTGDTYSVPEGQKEYDYLATKVVTGLSGSELKRSYLSSTYGGYTGDTDIGDRSYSFSGMQFNSLRDANGTLIPETDEGLVVVAGDGSSIINVYYDRQVVSYTLVRVSKAHF